jgi:hypothetical protein
MLIDLIKLELAVLIAIARLQCYEERSVEVNA